MTYSMPVWHLLLLFSLSFPFCLAHIHRWKRKSVYLIVKLFLGWGVRWPDALWVCVVFVYANVCIGNSLGATVSNAQVRQYHTPVLHHFLLSHLIQTHPLGAREAEVRDDKRRQIITVRPPFILEIFCWWCYCSPFKTHLTGFFLSQGHNAACLKHKREFL